MCKKENRSRDNDKAKVFMKKLAGGFSLSSGDALGIIKDFHTEMERGLSGKKSSLKMIPTFVDTPTGNETGEYIALDLGGTNFRVLEIKLKGKGKTSEPKAQKFALQNAHMKGDSRTLFDFIADCLAKFIKSEKIDIDKQVKLGFTFSFPVEQSGVASGRLIRWTKGFSTKGVIGKDVVALLDESLQRKGIGNIKVAALANDTVGTLVSLGYSDLFCDVGIILGTGTNACYREKTGNIKKWHGPSTEEHMIINSEWGNFNKLKLTTYDRMLDTASGNPGSQILEKMVSGMYLGEVARLILCDLVKNNVLFSGVASDELKTPYAFKTEYMSEIESDRSKDLLRVRSLLKKIGISCQTRDDRKMVKGICTLVALRAARVSAAAIASIVTRIDPRIVRRHTIAIDGSVYEKHPGFSKNIGACLKELYGARASLIRLALAKDGSGKGAAIIAAVAG